jgi:protein TonB
VKRLLPAIISALALHAIILSSDFSWLMLSPKLAPASRSLSITLSSEPFQKHRGPATVSKKLPESRFQPDLRQKPAAAQLENSTQHQKQSGAQASQTPRQKKSLKALTRQIRPLKARETAREESSDKDTTALAVHAKAFRPLSPTHPAGHNQRAPKTALIKKTGRVAGESTAPTADPAALVSRQDDRGAPAAALTLAKPLYRQNPAPAYPQRARRMGYEGIVMLKVLVDENGRVDDLTVLESSGYPILDRTALASVRKWLFEPGTEGGNKKKMWVRVPVRFRLK